VHSVALVASCRETVLEEVLVILAEVSMACAFIAVTRTETMNDGYQTISNNAEEVTLEHLNAVWLSAFSRRESMA